MRVMQRAVVVRHAVLRHEHRRVVVVGSNPVQDAPHPPRNVVQVVGGSSARGGDEEQGTVQQRLVLLLWGDMVAQ